MALQQNTVSTWTAQRLIDYARVFPWTTPAVGVAGYNAEPAVSFLDDIVKKIIAESNPWKWNAQKFPQILTQPYQQDYPTSVSQAKLGWLQSGILVDINNPNQSRAVLPFQAVQNLLPTFITARPQKGCWITNGIARTATWGGNGPFDPGPNTLYTNPLVLDGGGPGNNPWTALTDPNGNIQVLTTYGVTGGSQPSWPGPNAGVGTTTNDGSVVWTVQDPNGVALRIDALATFNSPVWAIFMLYQMKPPNITALNQNIFPIPDDLSYLVKAGFLAYCMKQAKPEEFAVSYAEWLADIQKALGSSDREATEFGFYPAQPIQGGGSEGTGVSTYGYPGWPGWS